MKTYTRLLYTNFADNDCNEFEPYDAWTGLFLTILFDVNGTPTEPRYRYATPCMRRTLTNELLSITHVRFTINKMVFGFESAIPVPILNDYEGSRRRRSWKHMTKLEIDNIILINTHWETCRSSTNVYECLSVLVAEYLMDVVDTIEGLITEFIDS